MVSLLQSPISPAPSSSSGATFDTSHTYASLMVFVFQSTLTMISHQNFVLRNGISTVCAVLCACVTALWYMVFIITSMHAHAHSHTFTPSHTHAERERGIERHISHGRRRRIVFVDARRDSVHKKRAYQEDCCQRRRQKHSNALWLLINLLEAGITGEAQRHDPHTELYIVAEKLRTYRK